MKTLHLFVALFARTVARTVGRTVGRMVGRMVGTTLAMTFAIATLAIAAGDGLSHAQTVEEFYRGRQVRMIVGHPAGSDYDIGARLLAKYLTRHLPGNPAIVVQNLPTAASVMAANMLFNTAARDGSVMGSFSRNLPSQSITGHANLQVDMRRFQWLGATSQPSRVCVSRPGSRITRAEQVFETEFIVAGGGASSGLSAVPTILNYALKTRFRIVEGYRAFPDAILALQRGEVEGLCNPYSLLARERDIGGKGPPNFLFYSEETSPLTGMPSIFKFVTTPEQAQLLRFVFASTQFGRPYVFPPEVPADRVAALQRAFAAAVADPELVREAKAANLDMVPKPAEELVALVEKLHATPPDILEVVRKLLPGGG